MIYTILLLLSSLLLLLFLLPIHSFYITNAAMFEQCSTGKNIYLNKFDLNKMHCSNKNWRHVFISLEYQCINKLIKRKWTIKTNVNQASSWPKDISILSNQDYSRLGKTLNQQNLIIEDLSKSFDPNNNQLITYLSTELPCGPQCRNKYTIIKDICTKNTQQLVGAKFNEFICYYGTQKFNFSLIKQQDVFNKLIDDNTNSNSNTGQKNPSTNNNAKPNSNTGQSNPSINNNTNNSNISALNANQSTFWKKNKLYFLIAGSILGVITIIVIIFIIFKRHQQSVNKDLEARMSINSEIE